MKLPSIAHALTDTVKTFHRFPLVILDAIIGAVCALVLIDYDGASGPTVLVQFISGAVLGFPFLIGLALTAEKWKWTMPVSLGVQSIGIFLVALYAASVPQDLTAVPAIHTLRLLMLTVGMLLFGFSGPFIHNYSDLGYWQFCKKVCTRIILSGTYAVVLWAGLAIALAALDKLFGVDIPGKRFGELWVFINGVFTTWFFLAGVPNVTDDPENVTEYPKGLKILSQYILLPLVLVYFVILYTYLGKVLLAWDWPQGWVSRLILGFIATGITSLLLVHPIKDRPENVWMDRAAKWFYVIILPLTVMLFLAVWQRVSEYGITEGRYLGLATVVWLCITAPYFIFSRKKNILFFTSSLCAVVFAISFGPWGMFTVSEASQVNRLKELLTEQHILVDGKIRSSHDSVSSGVLRQLISIVDYLSEVHGFEAIQPWFTESLRKDSTGTGDRYKEPAAVAALMGISYSRVRYGSAEEIITLSADRTGAMNIGGYDRMLRGHRIASGTAAEEFPDEGITYRVDKELRILTVTIFNDKQPVDSVTFNVKSLCDTLIGRYGMGSAENIPPEQMSITAKGKNASVKIFLSSIRLERPENIPHIIYFDALIAYHKDN